MVSILQELAEFDENSFDVDAFCETLVAYLPQTEVIPPEEITEWMFKLAKDQRDKNERKNKHGFDFKNVIEETANKGRKISESSNENLNESDKKRNTRMSESSDNSNPEFEVTII